VEHILIEAHYKKFDISSCEYSNWYCSHVAILLHAVTESEIYLNRGGIKIIKYNNNFILFYYYFF